MMTVVQVPVAIGIVLSRYSRGIFCRRREGPVHGGRGPCCACNYYNIFNIADIDSLGTGWSMG